MHYMEKQIRLVDKSKCTGCRACSNVCPTSSIHFELDGLHYYPKINEDSCIKCGKCISVCSPLQWEKNHPAESEASAKYFCAWNIDTDERYSSTSGGVGSALAKLALKKGWYVCGAAFDKDWKLAHIVSNDKSIINKIRGSKYLQSNTDEVYKTIKDLLVRDEKVLFIGTPCQADALKNCIPPRLIGNLILCEIICHGVNSPLVWNDYKRHLEEDHNSPITYYNFRSKSRGWGKLRVSYSFANGEKKDEPAYRNIFHSWFGRHYMMRESCFNCPYRTVSRYSDIVIGDFWGIENIEPTLDVKKGVSVVIANTSRGETFLADCNLTIKEINRNSALKVIKGYIDKTSNETKSMEIERMKQFEKDYKSYSFVEMYKTMYPLVTPMQKIISSILFHLHLKK